MTKSLLTIITFVPLLGVLWCYCRGANGSSCMQPRGMVD